MTESELSYRVEFPLLSVGPTKFKQVTAETSTPPYTLLGVKLLEYGKEMCIRDRDWVIPFMYPLVGRRAE